MTKQPPKDLKPVGSVFDQIQESLEGILDHDYLPPHIRGRRLSELDEVERRHVEVLIDRESKKGIEAGKAAARAKRVKIAKEKGDYPHTWMIHMNTKTKELIEKHALENGIKREGFAINDIIEKHFGLKRGSSLPNGYKME